MLVHKMMPLEDPKENLTEIWRHVRRLYKEMDVKYKFSSLKMTMFSSEGGNSESTRAFESSADFTLRVLCGFLDPSLMIIPILLNLGVFSPPQPSSLMWVLKFL